jgi:hypothetical protein
MTGSRLSGLTPYVERLLDDDYIQEQIGEAFTSLRRGSRRAKGHSPKAALKDRRLRSQLRDAAGSLIAAARALKTPPRPKRQRLRRGLVVGAAVGATAFIWQRFTPNSTGELDG